MPNVKAYSCCLLLGAALTGGLTPALAQSGYQILYSFTGGADGSLPYSTLIADQSGNLYGTAAFGGEANCGTVYQFTPGGTLNVLYALGSLLPDACHSEAGLVFDKQGNLYGTSTAVIGGNQVPGAVFELQPDGTEIVLHYLSGNDDGGSYASLFRKGANLYGTTVNYSQTDGVVFRLAEKDGMETLLHSFTGGSDGGGPFDSLIADKSGNLYGTASVGGTNNVGVVFKIATSGAETVLYTFTGGSDGGYPYGGLVFDKTGNLYGTTGSGGTYNDGTVFKLAPNGTESVVYSFTGGADGGIPGGSLIMGKKGNLYGTTLWYGNNNNGAVFEVSPKGVETTLHTFTGGSDGSQPYSNALIDLGGYLYGTTTMGGGTGCGGTGCGTIFRVKD